MKHLNRRDFLTMLATMPPIVLLPNMTAHNPPPAIAPAQTPPNIVLVMSDDQGWGDVGYYGGDAHTPNLDAMAENGLRLDRMYAAAPYCSPTRASVLTGRHPCRYGCYTFNYPLPDGETTIAELLRGAGYATGHFGKWHVGNVSGNVLTPAQRGFDEYVSAHHHFDFDPVLYRDGVAEQRYGESSALIVDDALDFVRRKAAEDAPFFAVVWFPSAHTPHIADEADMATTAEDVPELRSYYGELVAMDRAIGRLRDEMRTLGIHEDTLVWFCGDNGGREWLGNNGGRGGKEQIYEGGLRVPGIVEWPGRIAAGTYSDTPVSTCDMLPTLAAVAGVGAPQNLDGVDVSPLLYGQPFAHPPLGFWQFHYGPYDATGASYPPLAANVGHAAWLAWPWKLHKIADDDGARLELYNLVADPWESKNLVQRESEAGRLKTMRAALEAWQADVLVDMRQHSNEQYYTPEVQAED